MVSNLKTNSGSLCEIGELSTIVFDRNKAKLSKEATETLATVAAKINANPNCNIRVSGYGYTSKSAQQLSWDRVNAVVKYLTEKQGVSESRFIYNAGAVGNELIVTLFGTTDAGTGATSAPHPNLKK
jgi:outer membrane protein OmpA-like peptidoglycan-associated protein